MTEFDVRRFGKILALQARIDGMKAENEYRKGKDEPPAYVEEAFNEIADLMSLIADCADHQLEGYVV